MKPKSCFESCVISWIFVPWSEFKLTWCNKLPCSLKLQDPRKNFNCEKKKRQNSILKETKIEDRVSDDFFKSKKSIRVSEFLNSFNS